MKGLKKLALASAVLAASTGAFAMEAMQDDALSNTTGQSGLTILQGNTNVTINALRYTDLDGTTGASAKLGITNNVCTDVSVAPCTAPAMGVKDYVDSFSNQGTLQIANLSITANSIKTTVDIGTSTLTGQTGILIGSTINNLSVGLGGISLDNGSALVAGTNTPTYDATTHLLTAGADIGGIALTNINLPSSSAMLITAGAAQLGSSSGLTIANLIPIADLSLNVNYYNTSKNAYSAGAFTNGTAGLITLPIELKNILQGPLEIAAGNTVADGYNLASTEGLEIYMGKTTIGSIDIGAPLNGNPAGIMIAGTNVGEVGILGLTVNSSQLNVSGH